MNDALFRKTFQAVFQNRIQVHRRTGRGKSVFAVFKAGWKIPSPPRIASAEQITQLLNQEDTHALLETRYHLIKWTFYKQTQTPFLGTPFHVAKQWTVKKQTWVDSSSKTLN